MATPLGNIAEINLQILINETWETNSQNFKGIPDDARNTVIADIVYCSLLFSKPSPDQTSELASREVIYTEHRETPEFQDILALVRKTLPQCSLLTQKEETTLSELFNHYEKWVKQTARWKQDKKGLPPEGLPANKSLTLTRLSCKKLDRLLEKLNREGSGLPLEEAKELGKLASYCKERSSDINRMQKYGLSEYELQELKAIERHKNRWEKKSPENQDQQEEKMQHVEKKGQLAETATEDILKKAKTSPSEKRALQEDETKKLRFNNEVTVQKIRKGRENCYTPGRIEILQDPTPTT